MKLASLYELVIMTKKIKTTDGQLQIKISEKFATGKFEFAEMYLADDIKWNILGDTSIEGKEQVLEVSKMSQLENFPVLTIKNIVSQGNYVVIECTGEATAKNGKPYNQVYCDVFRFNEGKLKEVTTYLDTALSNEVSRF